MAGLYIHIPFCHGRCIYCDFYATPRRERIEEVCRGIIREIRARLSEISEPYRTIYIGGGTPSFIPLELFCSVIETIPRKEAEEFTVEANPEDVTPEWSARMAALGVNRVSLGVQSLDDAVLRSIGRRHTAAGARQAVDILCAAGITNISCDLIYGLPGQSEKDWMSDLRELMQWPITHLSAYCLTVYEGTALSRMIKAGRMTLPDDDALARNYDILLEETSRSGFIQYEIANFSRPGFQSRHNTSYWDPEGKWLGVGPAAYSYDGKVRPYNPADIETWLRKLPVPSSIEPETELDRLNDQIVTALRTVRGLDLSKLPPDTADTILRDASQALSRGLMTYTDHRLAIKPEHFLISDSLIRPLLRDY